MKREIEVTSRVLDANSLLSEATATAHGPDGHKVSVTITAYTLRFVRFEAERMCRVAIQDRERAWSLLEEKERHRVAKDKILAETGG